jgi:hypothetical protein
MILGMRRLRGVTVHLDAAAVTGSETTAWNLLKRLEGFDTSIANIRDFIPNIGQCDRQAERISTGFVESTLH